MLDLALAADTTDEPADATPLAQTAQIILRSILGVRVPCFARDGFGGSFEPMFHLRESRRRAVCMPLREEA